MNELRVVVVGGGLSGSLMALYLGQAGYAVTVYEKRSDPQRQQAAGGRNINLGITGSSLQLLAQVGLEQDLERAAVALEGRVFHSRNGNRVFKPYSKPGQSTRSILTPVGGVRSVSRSLLNAILIDKARNHPNVEYYFECEIVALDPIEGELAFVNSTGNQLTVSADAIIGADGAFSTVRCGLVRLGGLKQELIPFDYGYKELRIEAEPDGRFAIEQNALHLWPREGYLMIALPNSDGSFRCTLFLPHRGTNSLESLSEHDVVSRFFAESFADAATLMTSPESDYFASPTGKLLTLRCNPWHLGRTVLIGDACHAMLPFSGQGVNTAFDDCQALLNCFQEFAPDWTKTFSEYTHRRKQQTDTIANAGLAITPFLFNFVPEDGVGGQKLN